LIGREKLIGGEWVLVVQAKNLEVEIGIAVVEITEGSVVVAAGTPSGEDVLAIDESVYVAAKIHVVFGEGVREVVLDLELAIVVVAGKIEALAKFADARDEDFRCTGEDRFTLAGFALNQRANLIDLAAENGGQREDSADALVDEVFGVAE